jgi:glycosyltransferase involved in cell wall biosynthesis
MTREGPVDHTPPAPSGDMAPIRILHAVGGMNRGGVETWLMHVLRRIDRRRFKMDFLVHTSDACAYDDEIRSLGSNIIPCLHPRQPWRYVPALDRVLVSDGPYDVVHSHLYRFSGLVLRAANRCGVPVRIAHSHTAGMDQGAGLLRRLYLRWADHWLQQHATLGLACSVSAAEDLFGADWRSDPRWRVLSYGIDLAPFEAPRSRERMRAELGLAVDDRVLGHVGRFDESKNHAFLLEIMAAARRIDSRVRPLLVGDGPLRLEMERRAVRLGLRAVFAGSRPDVPEIMLGAMDAFVFPSLFEGLGLVLVEAQAAGLPVVTSDVVPAEATVVSETVRRLSLADSADSWARAALDALRPDRGRCLEAVTASPFNLAANFHQLLASYTSSRTPRSLPSVLRGRTLPPYA